MPPYLLWLMSILQGPQQAAAAGRGQGAAGGGYPSPSPTPTPLDPFGFSVEPNFLPGTQFTPSPTPTPTPTPTATPTPTPTATAPTYGTPFDTGYFAQNPLADPNLPPPPTFGETPTTAPYPTVTPFPSPTPTATSTPTAAPSNIQTSGLYPIQPAQYLPVSPYDLGLPSQGPENYPYWMGAPTTTAPTAPSFTDTLGQTVPSPFDVIPSPVYQPGATPGTDTSVTDPFTSGIPMDTGFPPSTPVPTPGGVDIYNAPPPADPFSAILNSMPPGGAPPETGDITGVNIPQAEQFGSLAPMATPVPGSDLTPEQWAAINNAVQTSGAGTTITNMGVPVNLANPYNLQFGFNAGRFGPLIMPTSPFANPTGTQSPLDYGSPSGGGNVGSTGEPDTWASIRHDTGPITSIPQPYWMTLAGLGPDATLRQIQQAWATFGGGSGAAGPGGGGRGPSRL